PPQGFPPTALPNPAPPPRPAPPPVTPPTITPPRAAPAPTVPPALPPPIVGTGEAIPSVTERTVPERAPPALKELEPQPGGLTSKEVARRALAVSPAVKQKSQQVVAANEKITQTIVSFLPRLTLLASYTRTSPITGQLGPPFLAITNADR